MSQASSQAGRVETIPVVDVSRYMAGEPGGLDAAAEDIRSAFETVGFMVLTGHGISADLIESTFAEAQRFHALPFDAKMALALNEHNTGYMAIGRYAVWTSDVNDNDKPDLNEAYFVKRERAADDPEVKPGRRFVGPNQWPDGLPGFREVVMTYATAMDDLGMRMLAPVARGLGLADDFFDAAFGKSLYSIRLSHYPPVAAKENQFGIAPHSDNDFMTFVAQTDVPGLQVRSEAGNWIDVPFIPGSFAVNSGDILHRWTNGHLKSTPHRAQPPTDQDRYAIPFFLAPNIDAVIECVPTCTGPDDPPRWAPFRYEDFLGDWVDANYDPAVQRPT
jgi:isopenicillin N synthase-like dioxygenase